MGYALFTARKLSLTTRLNLCNAQLMSNSERANALTQSIYAARTKSATEANKLTTEAYKTYTSSLKSANDIYKAVLDNEASTEEAKEDAKDKYTIAKAEADSILDEALSEISLGTAMDDLEIEALNMQQTTLDQQRETLETQLNAYSKELENVEKTEGEAIKSAAPNFGS